MGGAVGSVFKVLLEDGGDVRVVFDDEDVWHGVIFVLGADGGVASALGVCCVFWVLAEKKGDIGLALTLEAGK